MVDSFVTEIIQNCYKSKSKRLDIGQCGLTTVPPEVWEMYWLEELILGNNPAEESNYDLFKIDTQVYNILFSKDVSQNLKKENNKNETDILPLQFTNNNQKNNQLGDEKFDGLKKLQNLSYLNLNRCGLYIIDFILNIKKIDILLIGGNPGIQFGSPDLTSPNLQVRVLDLLGCSSSGSDMLIGYLEKIIDRKTLKILDVSYNRDNVSQLHLDFILRFTNLESLDISFCQNPDLQKILSKNKHLKFLRAENCNLTNPTFELPISNLDHLNLNSNGLIKLTIKPYKTNLKELLIENNRISDISFIKHFPILERLFLSRNNISLLNGIETLKILKVLNIEGNQIQDISLLSNLTLLNTLLISGNRINKLVFLKNLEKLQVSSLSNNKLTDSKDLEYLLLELPKLNTLHLFNNSFRDISKDLLGKNSLSNCLKEIKEYFAHIKKGETINNEIKLILVGNSTAGKTTLRKQLLNKKYKDKEDTTHGIVTELLKLKKEELKDFSNLTELQVQIWDFGGQEYYHETHKLFFSDNAVYIVVWEEKTNKYEVALTEVNETASNGKKITTRKFIEHHTCEYWLKNIRHYAPLCPVLVVQNKIDLYFEPNINNEDKENAQSNFKNVRIKKISDSILDKYEVIQAFDLSLKKYADKDPDYLFDYNKFQRLLFKILTRTVHEFKLGKSYFEIKKTIQNRKTENFWDYNQYLDVCQRIDPEIGSGINQLSKFLSNTSVILYYPEHPNLYNKIFINPIWVSDMIYSILDNNVLEHNGEFQKTHVINKFKDEKLADNFIELMEKFELIFKVTDNKIKSTSAGLSKNHKLLVAKETKFVAPQYLPEAPPTRSYSIYKKLCSEPKLVVRFPEFLPKTYINGILSKFASNSIDKSYYRFGVAFETDWISEINDENINIIECDFDLNQIEIYSKSDNPYNLREIFESILTVYTGFRSQVALNTGLVSITTIITDVVIKSQIPVHISLDGQNFVSWNELYERFYQINSELAPFTENMIIMATQGNPIIVNLFEAFYKSKSEVLSMASNRKTSRQPPKLFISYSHKDESYKDELLEHLSGMRRNGEIKDWTDRAIVPGEKWDNTIKKNLEEADIILFLVSSSFMASEYIHNIEIKKSIERYNQGKAIIIPISVRPFDYNSLPLKDIQSASKDFKPISTAFISRDQGWMEVIINLRASIERWKSGQKV